MDIALLAFMTGVFTLLSPCVFSVIPVVISGSGIAKSTKRILIIIGSLVVSLFIFTLLLKASTILIDVPPLFWNIVSWAILVWAGGITFWRIFRKDKKENNTLNVVWDILVGAAFGPVFSTCSPMYAVIVTDVLPSNYMLGVFYLTLHLLGLGLILLLISLLLVKLFQTFITSKKSILILNSIFASIIILVGFLVLFRIDKDIEAYALEQGILNITVFEGNLVDRIYFKQAAVEANEEGIKFSVTEPYQAPEIRDIQAWINSEGETLAELEGKVVLLDFWTYSCINCIRTLPFVTSWYETYKDDGFVVLGIHAPEFQFERKLENVQQAVIEYGIKYPVGLDNNFSTWRAYENRFWPAHYFIDKEGVIQHIHFGEGDYDNSERVIRSLLGLDDVEISEVDSATRRGQTPETYLGIRRMENFVNSPEIQQLVPAEYMLAEDLNSNEWSIGGEWTLTNEDIQSWEDNAKLRIRFSGKDVYLVLGSLDETPKSISVEILDPTGNLVDWYGEDIVAGTGEIEFDTLYHLVSVPEFIEDAILEITFEKGIRANAFTFGGA